MIRVVLAVLLAASVLAVALPAVDDARTTRTSGAMASAAERVSRAGRALVAGDDPTAPTVPGARRVVTVRVPADSWGQRGLQSVTIRGERGGATATDATRGGATATGTTRFDLADSSGRVDAALTYRLSGGGRRRLPLAVEGASVRTPDGPVVLGPGRRSVTLTLVADRGLAVVVRPTRGGAPTPARRAIRPT